MKFCILIIGAVSAYDNSMSVIYAEVLHEYEQNPIGLWLLGMGLDVFVQAKAAATLAVSGLCLMISKGKYRFAIPVVAAIQGGLFMYLSFFERHSHYDGKLISSPFEEFMSMQAKYWGL